MNVQLLDIDLEADSQEQPLSTLQHLRSVGYNRMDMGMLVVCGLMICILIAIFIWFEVQRS